MEYFFADMREQHESEIRNLENLMKASQDMLQQQVTKYSEQMQRLGIYHIGRVQKLRPAYLGFFWPPLPLCQTPYYVKF